MATIPKTSVALLGAIAANPDSSRWYDFYSRYQPVMESYLRAAFPSLEFEDVISETMIVLMEKLPNYHYLPDEKGLFRNYLTGIVKFKAIEALKRRKREADKRNDYVEETGGDAAVSIPSMTEAEEADWRKAAYETALGQLLADTTIKEQNKQIFLRVAVNGEAPGVVAEAFGITRNNVDQIKNRMIGRLRDLAKSLVER